eukprot:m.126288 g.126288  ORF g.126288 m.126288 type:complete len:78 (-) comp14688_c0_seq6:164-397(-)
MCGVIIDFFALVLRVIIFLLLLPVALVICFIGVIVYLIFLPFHICFGLAHLLARILESLIMAPIVFFRRLFGGRWGY